jgi:ribosomal protein S12 methylthiotransferase
MDALPIVDSAGFCLTSDVQEGGKSPGRMGHGAGQRALRTGTATGAQNAIESNRSPGKFCLVTLGCPKNLVDSERMAGLLGMDGYEMVREPEGSDFVVVNTCAFIGDSRSESHAVIREMLDLKKKGRTRGVIVTGCMAQREKEKLLDMYPGVDQLVGVFGREEIAAAAQRLITGLHDQRTVFRPAPTRALPDTHRLRITPRHLAFLKISEGCNRACTFCSIPQMRGKHASKPIEEIVAEAEELVASGAKELVIVAQDTTFYGIDLYGKPRLVDLLQRLESIAGLMWIRLMYFYPMYITDELLDVIAGSRKILPYIDIPLQHIDDDVLRRMRRATTREKTEQLLDRLRARIPQLVLRTTLIAGFPGESDEQFGRLLEFVERRKFERLGAFAYSQEPTTPSGTMPSQLPDEIKLARKNQLLAAQQKVAFAWSQAQVGRRLDVILDSPVPGEPSAFVGRTYADAPEVDGAAYVSGENLAAGQIVSCEIVAARGYDLIAVAMEPLSQTQ